VNFEMGWYRGKLYISELLARSRESLPVSPAVNDKYTRIIRKYCSKGFAKNL